MLRYEVAGFIWSAVKWSADLIRHGLGGLGFHSEQVNQMGTVSAEHGRTRASLGLRAEIPTDRPRARVGYWNSLGSNFAGVIYM